jgi:hypothetical protein
VLHRPDLRGNHFGIAPAYLPGEAAREAHWIAGRSYDPEHVRGRGADVVWVNLRVGEVQIPGRPSIECHLLHVPDDPDDLHWPRRPVVVVHQEASTDRVQPLEPLADQLLVHNRHRRRPVSVALRQAATELQRDARRFEVPWRHGAKLREGHVLSFNGSALDGERNAPQEPAQREQGDRPGIRDGRQRRQSLGERPLKPDNRVSVVESPCRQGEARR